MNGAYVPYYFNNEQIVSIQQEIKEDDYHVLHIVLQNGAAIPIACSLAILQRNWKEIVAWDEYRFGRPEYDAIRSFGSRFDNSTDEEMPVNPAIHPSMVPDNGTEDGEIAGGVE